MLLGFCLASFGILFWSVVFSCLKLVDRIVSDACFIAGGVLNCDLPIVDLWQCCVCCTRSGVILSTHFVALYLCLVCQSGLHAVL